jgi:beta-N-acetylhexosaminidase
MKALLRVNRATFLLAIFLIIALLSAHGFPTTEAQTKKSSSKQSEQSWAEKTLASMTLDQKIGQLIIPAVIGQFLSQDSDAFKQIARDITEFHVGGYHMLGEVNNLHEPAGVALLLNHIQQLASVPLLITADFEGGVGLRYTGATRLPRAMAMGATADPEMATLAARITAAESRAMGFQVNFYPVVDVNNNARNPIINIRSFGGDPSQVSRMARAYIRGLQNAGVMATAKHFPGHGDTSTDSHMELPVVDVDRSRLDAIELPPFKAAVDEGVGAVMSAHIAIPMLEPDKTPATLSPKMLDGILRKEMKFNGLIFTDALNMRGVAAHYSDEDAAVRAIKAGADILLYPPSVEHAFQGVKKAVQSGAIPEARINESVHRILLAKQTLGLDKNRFTDINKLDQLLGTRENRDAAQRIIDRAITLVRDDRGYLPLKLDSEKRVLAISMVDNAEGWRDGVPGRAFVQGLMKRHQKVATVYVTDRTPAAELELIKKLAAFSDVVIVNTFIRVASYKGSIDLSEGEIELLKHLSGIGKPLAFVLYGSPYLISFVPELPSYILAYEYYPAAEEAALKCVLGEVPFKGKLPVELPGFYNIGHTAAK